MLLVLMLMGRMLVRGGPISFSSSWLTTIGLIGVILLTLVGGSTGRGNCYVIVVSKLAAKLLKHHRLWLRHNHHWWLLGAADELVKVVRPVDDWAIIEPIFIIIIGVG